MTRVLGSGTVVKHDHNADSSYTTISQVERVKVPDDFDFNETEVTALSDTTEQFVRGIQKAKTCEITVYWDEADTSHTNLRTGADDDDGFPWQIVTADATPKTISFDGYILKIGETTMATKEAVMKTITVRLTSEPSYA